MGRDCASERVPIALAEADQRDRDRLPPAVDSYDLGVTLALDVIRPRGHYRTPPLQEVRSVVGPRHSIPDAVAETTFRNFKFDVANFGRPRPERGSKSVNGHIDVHPAQEHRQGHIAERALGNDAQEHEAVGGRRALSNKIGTDASRYAFGATIRNSKRGSGQDYAPFGQRSRASLFVDFASGEMTFLVEDPMGSG